MSLPFLSVILPAFNEERAIARALVETEAVLRRCPILAYEILVVDDGSTDQTRALVESFLSSSIRLIKHGHNCGKGAAIQTGIKEAQGDVIVFFDCDLSVHPDILLSLDFDHVPDVLIGSRCMDGAKILIRQPWQRVAVGRGFNWMIRTMFALPYKDTQCGFKLFSRMAAESVFLDLRTSGWAFDVEILLRARRANFSIQEIPVTWQNGRESRVRWSDAWNIMNDLWKLKKEEKSK